VTDSNSSALTAAVRHFSIELAAKLVVVELQEQLILLCKQHNDSSLQKPLPSIPFKHEKQSLDMLAITAVAVQIRAHTIKLRL